MGRWFVRIVGPSVARKVRDSAEALRSEYEAGRKAGTETERLKKQESAPREVSHRVVESAPIEEPSPDESGQESRESGSG